jgi:cobalt-zinc-cadmium efflux system protein
MFREYHKGPRAGEFAQQALGWAFWLHVVFLVIETVGGILTDSLALLSDAGHMLSDVGALAIAWVAGRLVRRRASAKRTYGYGRAEILAALINGLTLWLVVGAIFVESIRRLTSPPAVLSGIMLAVALAGLAVNVACAAIIFRHRRHDLNLRGAFLHLTADSVSSVGVVVAGLIMWRFQWFIADPLASLLIGILILLSSWGLIKESVNILLEGTPAHLDIEQVRARLESLEGVETCHDLHIWMIGSGEPVLTAHLTAKRDADRTRVLREATTLLSSIYRIGHITIQVEKETLPEWPHG